MPDAGGRRKRGHRWHLSDAHDIGQLIRINCGLCNTKRWFVPGDLVQVLGNLDIDIAGKLLCVKCVRKDYTRAESHNLTGSERQGVRLRRLQEIKMVRRVIWRDE